MPGGQKAVNGVHGSLGSTQHNLHLSLIAFALCLGLLFFWLSDLWSLISGVWSLVSDLWPLISGLWSTWANINRRKKSLHKIAFLLYKNEFFQEAVCKKNIFFVPYFFAVFFRGKSPPLEGRVVVTWELNAVRKIFFWPILLKSVQPKKFLVGLAMLMQWGVLNSFSGFIFPSSFLVSHCVSAFCVVWKNRNKFTFVCVCVCLCLCLCVCVTDGTAGWVDGWGAGTRVTEMLRIQGESSSTPI